jgi:hypothetical protein
MALADSVFNTIFVGVDGARPAVMRCAWPGSSPKRAVGDLVAVRVFPYQHRPALAGSPALEEERESTQMHRFRYSPRRRMRMA